MTTQLQRIDLHVSYSKSLVVPEGFEPSQTGPKPVVLPLHHGTIQEPAAFTNWLL